MYDALLKKAKYTDAERFACVVAHPRAGTAGVPDQSLVGVVEVSIQGDAEVNEVLGVDEYCASRRLPQEPPQMRRAVFARVPIHEPLPLPCVCVCVYVRVYDRQCTCAVWQWTPRDGGRRWPRGC